MRRSLSPIFSAVALSAAGVVVVAPMPIMAAGVSVSVSCNSNPERTTIRNNTGHRITINSVGSTYQPYSNEPFHVGKSIASGTSITYQTGYAASSHVLTRRHIYNSNGLDGARATTSVGTFTRYC